MAATDRVVQEKKSIRDAVTSLPEADKLEIAKVGVEDKKGLVSLGVTGRDDISMQFASRDFRPCWIYTWVAVKLPLASR